VARLAPHPRIVAIKEAVASLERIVALRESCGEEMVVLSGDDPTAAEAMLLGAAGVISVTANVVPRAMSLLCEAALRGDAVEVRAMDARLQPLHAAMFVEPNPIPAKWALAEMGRIQSGIRLPLTPLTVAGQATVRRVMNALEVVCGS
jgi:4-hydroxy-tetrahydrodipicolinate synthase